MEHQLAQLEGLATEAILVVGYRKEQIESHFGSDYHGIRLRYVEQTQQRGTADAVLAAREHVSERLLILNGDDFYHRRDLEALAQGGRGLLVTQAPDPQNRAVVRIEDDAIRDIVEKPKDAVPGAWCSVGGYCVEAEDLAALDGLPLSPRGELELPDFVLRVVAAAKVHPQPIREWWLPLTYAWDVLTAMNYAWASPERAAELQLEVTTSGLPADVTFEGPVWLGEGARIGAGSKIIGPSSIGPGAVVGERVELDNVALFTEARVGDGARISASVVGARAVVGEGATLSSRPGTELTVRVKDKPVVPELGRLGSVLGDGAKIDAGETVAAGTLVPVPSA